MIVAFDRSGSAPLDRLDAAVAFIRVEGIDEIRDGLQPSDRVVCTDELGCLMLVGRIDRWLALDDYVRERFLVRRGDATRDRRLHGSAGGVSSRRSVRAERGRHACPIAILIVDIFKEYPIGNSRSWLPKAIEEDGLQVVAAARNAANARHRSFAPGTRYARLTTLSRPSSVYPAKAGTTGVSA